MIIQPNLLKTLVLETSSRVFVCGPGYASDGIVIRDKARAALQEIPRVETICGEEIERNVSHRKLGTDLQTVSVVI